MDRSTAAMRWRARLLLPTFAVLAPLLLLELSLRFVGPLVPSVEPLLYYPRIAHQYDQVRTLEELLDTTVLGFQPNTTFLDFILNSKSFRTRDYTEKKPPGTLRILAIGDSFTFALNVPYQHSWPVRLQEELQKRTESRVEVLNLAVPDVGPEFELRLWELEGAKLQADLVVVAFPVGSNFYASARVRRDRTWPERFAHWSYSFRFVRNVIRLKAARPAGKGREPLPGMRVVPEGSGGVPVSVIAPGRGRQYDQDKPNMTEESFASLESSHLKVCSGLGMDAMFDSTAQTLIRFRQEVVASGAEFVVMVCPAELQTSPEYARRALESGKPPPGLLTDLPPGSPPGFPPGSPLGSIADRLTRPQEFLRGVFDREGIRHLDLLPAFREAAAHQVLYGLRDSHWNPQGNAVAADALVDYLSTPPESGEPWPWANLLRGAPDRHPDAADTPRDR